MEHTKGPWKADNVAEGYIYAGETLVASAQCETLHFKAKGITPAQMNTNARLIAAAPALLAACEQMQKHFKLTWLCVHLTPNIQDGLEIIEKQAKAAIEAAKGKKDENQ